MKKVLQNNFDILKVGMIGGVLTLALCGILLLDWLTLIMIHAIADHKDELGLPLALTLVAIATLVVLAGYWALVLLGLACLAIVMSNQSLTRYADLANMRILWPLGKFIAYVQRVRSEPL